MQCYMEAVEAVEAQKLTLKFNHFSRHILNLGINAGNTAQSRLNGLKNLAKLFNFVVFQSVSIFSILIPLCFVIISLVFFYLCKVLYSGFPQFNSNFVDAQSNSKYRD